MEVILKWDTRLACLALQYNLSPGLKLFPPLQGPSASKKTEGKERKRKEVIFDKNKLSLFVKT